MMRVLAVLLALAALPAWAADAAAERDECLGCHGDASMSFDLSGGEKLPLFVDKEVFARSIHGEQDFACTQCHQGKTADHATGELPYKTPHDVARQHSQACQSCHAKDGRKVVDAIHFAAVADGSTKVPACSDCHGAHDVTAPDDPRTRIPGRCARCHEREAATFARSVHGRAVDSNADVPVCTDCHRAHDDADPTGGALVLRTPQICGRCHTDEKRMKKYGISTQVVATYLADFHGMATTLQRSLRRGSGVRLAAGCTDCHGVHDIERPNDPRSRVMADNLQKTCARCHAGASATFPRAWLSHWEPSPQKAPLVWAMRLFYRMLIPFMVGGLSLQIALHLWRAVVNR